MFRHDAIVKRNLLIDKVIITFIYYNIYIDSSKKSLFYLDSLIKQYKLDKEIVYKNLRNFIYNKKRQYNLYISLEDIKNA